MGITSTSNGLSSKTVEVENKRALVRRVIESPTFAKSERLSSFLSCICDLTLSGRATEINEQKIGTTVFGRAPDYDSSIDGIVRPQASRLRQRLDTYFSGEGAHEPVRITLPRGSYIPVFQPNAGQDATLAPLGVPATIEPPAPHPESSPARRTLLRNPGLPWTLVIILAAALFVTGVKSRSRRASQAPASQASHPFWSLILRSDQRTIVIPSDTGVVMWQSATSQTISLGRYLSGSFRAQSTGDTPTGQINAGDLASRRYTSIVDLAIVKQLTQIADGLKSKVVLSYARDTRVDDLKEANVVLIGAAAANPWLELFEPQMNFVFTDAHIRQYTVLNRSPNSGEPSSWTADYDDPQHRVYGVVSFLPNLGGMGNVLILEGTSMAGTQCAWDFVADDSSLLPFLDRIKRRNGSIPHFQLVLNSTNLTGSAGKAHILAWRVMD